MEKSRRLRKLNIDERGTSLVEIVVALLILCLIFVPLISSFVTSAKVTARTSKMSAADNVAVSVLEAAKALGAKATSEEFLGGGADFKLAKLTSGSAITVVSGSSAYTGEFSATKVIEGSDTYNVKLEIQAVNTKVNTASGEAVSLASFSVAEMSAFNGEATLLITPGKDYDINACSQYLGYNDYAYSIYQERLTYVNEYNSEIERGIRTGEYLPAPDEVIKYNIDVNDPAQLRHMEGKILRDAYVAVTIDPDHPGEYCINSWYEYNYGGSLRDIGGDQHTLTYNRFCNKVFLEIPDTGELSLYFMYLPLFGDTAPSNYESLHIAVGDNVDQPINLFIPVQQNEGNGFDKLKVEVESGTNLRIPGYIYDESVPGTRLGNAAEKYVLYSQVGIDCVVLGSDRKLGLTKEREVSDVIYKAKVTIIDPLTGEILSELSSDIEQ